MREREVKMKTLWIKRLFLNEILNGRKTVEVRVGYDNIRTLRAGQELLLNEEHPVKIKEIRNYETFDEMLANEDPETIVPGMGKKELGEVLRSFYPPYKERLGVVALELERTSEESR